MREKGTHEVNEIKVGFQEVGISKFPVRIFIGRRRAFSIHEQAAAAFFKCKYYAVLLMMHEWLCLLTRKANPVFHAFPAFLLECTNSGGMLLLMSHTQL